MAHALVALLFFLGQPFWEAKTPEQWSLEEINSVRGASPWVQNMGHDPAVLVYLATAAPIQDAEHELQQRTTAKMRLADPDYLDFMELNKGKVVVLAIPWAHPEKFGTAADRKRMEEESVMVAGKKKVGLVGHFPPSATDPVLRLVFPRELKGDEKTVVFRLYLPEINFPEREAEFWTKDLMYRGKLTL